MQQGFQIHARFSADRHGLGQCFCICRPLSCKNLSCPPIFTAYSPKNAAQNRRSFSFLHGRPPKIRRKRRQILYLEKTVHESVRLTKMCAFCKFLLRMPKGMRFAHSHSAWPRRIDPAQIKRGRFPPETVR